MYRLGMGVMLTVKASRFGFIFFSKQTLKLSQECQTTGSSSDHFDQNRQVRDGMVLARYLRGWDLVTS
jgi:hypothetical protein